MKLRRQMQSESVAFSLDRKQLENPFLFSDKTTIVYRKDVIIC